MKRILAAAGIALALGAPIAHANSSDHCMAETAQLLTNFRSALETIKGANEADTHSLIYEMNLRKDEALEFMGAVGDANHAATRRNRTPLISCADGLQLATGYVREGGEPPWR
jgi:hypothetical protein